MSIGPTWLVRVVSRFSEAYSHQPPQDTTDGPRQFSFRSCGVFPLSGLEVGPTAGTCGAVREEEQEQEEQQEEQQEQEQVEEKQEKQEEQEEQTQEQEQGAPGGLQSLWIVPTAAVS